MMFKSTISWIMVAGCLMASVGYYWPSESSYKESTLDTTLFFKPGGLLSIDNDNGDISVKPWDREEIKIEATKCVWSDSPSQEEVVRELDKIEIDIKESKKGVAIETRLPRRLIEIRYSYSKRVDCNILIPKEADLEFKTVNGMIKVEGIEVNITVKNRNGNINLKRMKGNIEAKTMNGYIDFKRAKGDIEAKTINGGINCDITAFPSPCSISLNVENGGINLLIPESPEAFICAMVNEGKIDSDFPIYTKESAQRECPRPRVQS